MSWLAIKIAHVMTDANPYQSPHTTAKAERAKPKRFYLASAACSSVALYAPFAWLLTLDFTSKGYHLYWLCMWPILPGLLAGIPFKQFDDAVMFTVMGIATFAMLALLTYVGGRSRFGILIAMLVALVISIPTSALAYMLFRN